MTTMDTITEEIAHFIGLFHTNVEDARLRDAYKDFSLYTPEQFIPPSAVTQSHFEAPYDLLGFDPYVAYKSPASFTPLWHPRFVGGYDHPSIPVVEIRTLYGRHEMPQHEYPFYGSGKSFTWEIQPPGSVANFIVQAASLSDNDSFAVGGHGLTFNPTPVDNGELLDTAQQVLSDSPIGHLEMPTSGADLIEIIKTVADQLDSLSAESGGPMGAFVHQSATIDGIYVNGILVDEAPKLEDHHSFEDDDADSSDVDAADSAQPSNVKVFADGSVQVEASVELVGGNNTAVNDAVLKNIWTGATVTAVVGDHFEINAIIQINVLHDTDAITSAINSWTSDDVPDEIFNIATFQRVDPLESGNASAHAGGGYPGSWAVTEIHGDLLIANWLEQYIFMSDNDVGILSSSGATTKVIAGDNTSVNQTSIYELSHAYDLILIGGSLYDANIIHQTNILFDNDVVGAVTGFGTTGEGTISSAGNLLWNQAHIYNIGGADRFDTLPSAYVDAANDFAGGGRDLPDGILTDSAFAGLAGLRVLYISGDLLNIQYVSQTTIVGDSDQIALAMNAFNPHAEATWSISTGGNALINNAAIADLDSLGRTYVGGEQYSQETLFQSGLISSHPEWAAHDPDALVNEAVAFLDDSMLDADPTEPGFGMPVEHDGQYQNDGLQHVLG
ncbi:hypothetical protein PMI07_000273 [Rhizobium sp. CF080]|uniref:hypothetical protein n=1 Tax=Rhizobium sp. (strain CF080) TaxID=1144310 RepID=UPI000271C580|nr:hypothetical protein [Rhizobium sp. CF080]EUB97713.1 hypothetical protein PMI07_000273 [Rhizobium sp. CF080]